MNKFINENLLKMNTEEFLSNIKKVFNEVFSDGNIEKINLMNYLSENKWLNIKKCGLLLPFLSEKLGGRKESQFEILNSLSEGNLRMLNKLMFNIFELYEYFDANQPTIIGGNTMVTKIIEMAAIKSELIDA